MLPATEDTRSSTDDEGAAVVAGPFCVELEEEEEEEGEEEEEEEEEEGEATC